MIYIVAPVNFESYAGKFGLDLVISAASNKVFGIAQAIHSAAEDVAIISFPKIVRNELRIRNSILITQDSIPILFAPTTRFSMLRRVLNALYFLYATIFIVTKKERLY